MGRGKTILMCCLTAALAGAAGVGSRASATGLDAEVHPFNAAVEEIAYPSTFPDGSPADPVEWRVAKVGNGLENWLTTTESGSLVDLGGTYPRISDDEGQSWTTVVPRTPPVAFPLGFEGAVSAAPDGDIVGMTWGGPDEVITYKYDARMSKWLSNVSPLHTPLFDRPLLAVIPGPISIAGVTHSYVTILKGGLLKDPFYISLDGLNYTIVSTAAGAPSTGPVSVARDADLDYAQPQTFGVTPLGGGRALHFLPPGLSGASGVACFTSGGASYMETPFVGSCYRWPFGRPFHGHVVADSNGYLHEVKVDECCNPPGQLTYSISLDGGATWMPVTISFPPGFRYDRTVDIKANGTLGISAILVHLQDSGSNLDQDLLYRFTYNEAGPTLQHIDALGNGDENFDVGIGLNASNPRFDFTSLAILPSGKIAASFGDAAHQYIALAVEK